MHERFDLLSPKSSRPLPATPREHYYTIPLYFPLSGFSSAILSFRPPSHLLTFRFVCLCTSFEARVLARSHSSPDKSLFDCGKLRYISRDTPLKNISDKRVWSTRARLSFKLELLAPAPCLSAGYCCQQCFLCVCDGGKKNRVDLNSFVIQCTLQCSVKTHTGVISAHLCFDFIFPTVFSTSNIYISPPDEKNAELWFISSRDFFPIYSDLGQIDDSLKAQVQIQLGIIRI